MVLCMEKAYEHDEIQIEEDKSVPSLEQELEDIKSALDYAERLAAQANTLVTFLDKMYIDKQSWGKTQAKDFLR